MSCYEWTEGTIIIPADQYAAFRKGFEDHERVKQQTIFDNAQKFWDLLTPTQRRNQQAYHARLDQMTFPEPFGEDITWVLRQQGREKPRRLLKSDLVWPTNRTKMFSDGDLVITFSPTERRVTYSVMENNHAREWADRSPLGRLWATQISHVRWTRGSGGVLLGNDEYHRDAGYSEAGAGGSYVVAAYGYLGAKEAPANTAPFINGAGERVKVESHYVRGRGLVGKVVPDRSRVGMW